MTPQEHPITPPPELIMDWCKQWTCINEPGPIHAWIAAQAARWGADQELEACINYFHEYDPSWGEDSELITGLRAARRPKPPSLKEQALAQVESFACSMETLGMDSDLIRRALEQLND
jgi:hypothetical protein